MKPHFPIAAIHRRDGCVFATKERKGHKEDTLFVFCVFVVAIPAGA
ncbi:MAG: hypothetical protein WC789_00920 [Lentisphaeria bacterium]|jgi:hypothetical protein